jgi:hypothetical protein
LNLNEQFDTEEADQHPDSSGQDLKQSIHPLVIDLSENDPSLSEVYPTLSASDDLLV